MEEDWTAAFEHRALELGLMSHTESQQGVEELASGILSACNWATEAVMESRPSQRKALRAPWWNEDCSAACARVVEAKEKGMDRGEVHTCTSHLWYSIRRAKRSFFDDICSSARPDNIWGINQWYRGQKTYGLPTLRSPDGTLATTNSDKANLLHSTFFPYSPGTPTGTIKANLASCSNKSAPGACGINYRLLRWAFAAQPDLFEGLYNAMLLYEYHPTCLKNTLIAPIPKPNKFDFASPKAYRPISLLETLSKLFEKIMAARFTALSGLHGLIPPEQFGGKDMSSCMDAGLALVHDIESAWDGKQQASITLLDISGYFNNIDHGLLIRCMQKMGYPARVLGWLRSYLSERTASFQINNEVGLAFELQERGIPQGSPLSPVFSSIFTALMLMSLRACGLWVRAYIDDLCLFAQSDMQEGCIADLTESTRATLDALLDMGLSAEASKTELIHFAKSSRDMTKNLPLILGDRADDIIRGANTVRWLGFFLDRRLNFKDHISRMATRAKNSKTHCKTLQTIQNIACQWALGSFRTAPTAVLEHTIAMPPIVK
ncbi:RNA-directed DNA polymerase from transposon BS [Ceratobasidium theobromae]|uniref:RNA-directed DNA polymerase from transposon BS n=1 Tax=Ceratobasidium theobromae TaxID=1582974 RepID=A0A5N5QH40_9AGAM|nr:RNA-directed DNA polymerase from transposon BS [Ceratobasidium theobromae]